MAYAQHKKPHTIVPSASAHNVRMTISRGMLAISFAASESEPRIRQQIGATMAFVRGASFLGVTVRANHVPLDTVHIQWRMAGSLRSSPRDHDINGASEVVLSYKSLERVALDGVIGPSFRRPSPPNI
ncbi:hypothetical protein [Bradyrhizobium sp. RDI18]|uniref:hypothetical protein n=1 Tax=Bradyrhizobium sp. RDI18 TaxID=3367400 RepID=UPI0037103DD5